MKDKIDLAYCSECMQMTNHIFKKESLLGECLKCKDRKRGN